MSERDASLDEFADDEDKSDWSTEKLDSLLTELQTGNRPTGGAHDEGKYISIGGTQIDSDGYIDLHDLVYIPEEYFEKVSDTQLQRHDILMVKDGANTGDVAIAWEAQPDIVTNEHVMTLRLRDDLNQPYTYYYLLSHEGWKQLKGTITGSAQEGINKSFAGKVDITYPPIEQQRKIASVLYNVDEAIQKTEEIIKQLQTVRQGTEQDVLSRGVLEDSTLRADDEIEYRSSWVGEIPQDWEVKQYRELISASSVGIVVKPSQYYDDSGTVPILRSKDISADGIVEGDFEYMTEESNAENENSQLREGDVITVRSGDPGLSCVVSSEFDGANSADLLISTPGPDLDSHYAALWINSFAGRKQIDRFQAGLAQKHFNLGALRKLRVGVPSLDEQKRIIEKVSSISESLERERKCKKQLQRIKQGLMQNLLSGEIRTADRDINIYPEVKKDE